MHYVRRMNRVLPLIFATMMLLTLPVAMATDAPTLEASLGLPVITEMKTIIGDNAIHYPQLEGLVNEAVQQTINDAIVEKAKIAQRMVTLSTLQAGSAGIIVTYEAYLGGGIFSTVISAKGVMENGRNGQEYATLSVDLASGEPLTMADLFQNPDDAVTYMEETLENTYLDELSSYLENSSLTPLPQNSFSLDASGITFYYPYKQFSLLSGYSGAAQFNYDELADYLITEEGALPAKLGALPEKISDQEIKASIEKTVAEGTLPHMRAKLGDSMKELINQYRLLRTPDQYPGGRYFQLEAPAFRQVLVLSDALTTGWDNSKAEGLLSYRANLAGIRTGETTRDRWVAILGTPESSVDFSEDMAFDYGFPAGTADYYTFGNRQLLLYAGEDGILYAVRLT